MGLRTRLRRRLKGVTSSPQPEAKKTTTPSAADPSQPHLPKPPEETTLVENLQRNVKPLAILGSIAAPPASRTSVDGGARTDPSVISSRTSLFDNASRLRRLFREKLLKKLDESEASENDIPDDISEEDLKEGDMGAGVLNAEASLPSLTSWTDGRVDAEMGKLIPVGFNAGSAERVNDGYVSFVVPDGWTACRKEDCFYLLKGLSVGYVRSVPSTSAANALMETSRLQIVSNVCARTSPEFGTPRRTRSGGKKGEEFTDSPYMQIDYSSHFGMGKGCVARAVYNLFSHGVATILVLTPPCSLNISP